MLTPSHESSPLLGETSRPLNLNRQFNSVLKLSPLNILLVFFPLGILSKIFEWNNTSIFVLNFIAIVPLAKLLSFATEEIALKTNQSVGALVNASFGNLTELILTVFALREGLIKVVQASLLGSILSNTLLVLGASLLAGGIYHPEQTFNPDSIQATNSMMSISVVSFVIPAAFFTVSNDLNLMLDLSRVISIILLILYVLYLVFQLKTHASYFQDTNHEEEEEPKLTLFVSIALLIMITVCLAFSAEYLVGSIEGISETWGLSEAFVGLILLPLVGNAAEHVTAITSAAQNKMGLALGVALGSSLQIALFVVPFTVLLAWAMGLELSLHFSIFETVILFLSVFLCNGIVSDGKSNWLEGVMLLALYVMVGYAFYIV